MRPQSEAVPIAAGLTADLTASPPASSSAPAHSPSRAAPSLKHGAALALVLGALNVFAFAPYGIWPLQLVCVTLLFALVLRAATVRQAFVLGWLYSFAWTCAGVHWLYISLHDFGGMPGWLTVTAIALLALGLGLIVGAATGAAMWLAHRWRSTPALCLMLILPALWMLAEWTRCWIFTGFPWLGTGYAHTAAPLAGFAPILGVYGISYLAALVSGAAVLLARGPGLSSLPSMPWLSRTRTAAILTIVTLLGAGQALRGVDWTRPHGQPITVRLLQGNIPQDMKFDQSILASTLGLYEGLIMQAPADLIATPETAIPVIRQQLPPDYLQRLADYATASGSHLLVGLPISDSPSQYTNGLIVLGPTPPKVGALPVPIALTPPVYRYDKHHLVPFGEFIPTGFRWFVDFMHIPLGDQTRGDALQAPFAVKDQWILPNICYEDLFGEEIGAQIRERALRKEPTPTMMINISNIAWFGDSIALPQHRQISQMRTLETGRPMLRATNTGATAVIDPHGRVQAELPPYSRGSLSASVQGYEGMTPFILFGNVSIVVLALLALLAAGLIGRGQRHRQIA
ncbi:MAG: apolipoprotein N-acyltransferase [Herminiimonas sp.]|nr:apolipoprotein N-acyltransferase [Herminiimonas sp.]